MKIYQCDDKWCSKDATKYIFAKNKHGCKSMTFALCNTHSKDFSGITNAMIDLVDKFIIDVDNSDRFIVKVITREEFEIAQMLKT